MCRWAIATLTTLILVSLTQAAAPPETATGGLTNIIPSPQVIESRQGHVVLIDHGTARAAILVSERAGQKERTAAEHINKRIAQIAGCELPITSSPTGNLPVTIALGSLGAKTLPDGCLKALAVEDQAFLVRKGGTEQDYVIDFVKTATGERLVLCGSAPDGVIYAAMSLLAMLSKSNGQVTVPRAHIRDYPDIEYRWLAPARLRRPEDRIDYAMQYKINIISAPVGYSLSLTNAEEKLRLNRYARARAVKLLNLAFGDLNLKNRRSYPDGATYTCLDEGEPSERAYCVSNNALVAEKQRILREYVDAVEPGCLYIHFVDEDDYNDAVEIWSNRCPECRKKWPNDTIETPDGKAGAQAYVFDKMAEAIFSVKHADSGYDASRDCLVIFVSAPYTQWSENDAAWDKEIAYHTTVSRMMKHVENVHFCIRENSLRDNGTKRTAELAEALRRQGKGHGLFMYLVGGDRRHQQLTYPTLHSRPLNFTCGPVLLKSVQGCASVLVTGTSHPLMRAEYAWNVESTGFYLDPKTRKEWGQAFVAVLYDRLRDGAIHGEGGFVDRACAHMYGGSCGALMRPLYVPQTYGQNVPEILPPMGDGWLTPAQKVRSVADSPEMNRKWAKLFAAYKGAADKAVPNIRKCLSARDFNVINRAPAEESLCNVLLGRQLAALAETEALRMAALAEVDKASLEKLNAELTRQLAEARIVPSECSDPSDRNRWLGKIRQFETWAQRRLASLSSAQAEVKRLPMKKKEVLAHPEAQRQQTLASVAMKSPTSLETDIAGVAKKKFLLLGGARTVSRMLREQGIKHVSCPQRLPDSLKPYHVIALLGHVKITRPCDLARLHRFVEDGGGLLLTGAAPYLMAGESVKLDPILLLTGAKRYNNVHGQMQVLHRCYLTQDLVAEKLFMARKGSACLTDPLTGVAVLGGAKHATLVTVLASTYGKGRSAFMWNAVGDQALLLRILCYLAGANE